MNATLLRILGLATVLALSLPASAGRSQIVASDFEQGMTGWIAVDDGSHSGRTSKPEMISLALSDTAASGKRGLEISFHPGQGWANAGLQLQNQAGTWAEMRVDEVAFMMKGDGSDKQVKIGLQTWCDDLMTPTMFDAPVSLKDTSWHEVVIPLSEFQRSNPSHPLRLPSLISFQVNGSGEIGPAKLWIDDVRARSAHGDGRYAVGPLDKQIAERPPVKALPRFGNWMWPGRDENAMKQCLALGIQFSSTDDTILQQQRVWLAGIVTSYSVGRPSGPDITSGLGLTDADMDQDAQGRPTGEGIQSSVFLPAVADRFYDYVRSRVHPLRNAPWVASFVLSSPISMYGEAHYAPSTAYQYAVFSRPAKASFRSWLKREYMDDLPSVSRAWGKPFKSWDEIIPPDGHRIGSAGIDIRTEWSDFIHWYNWWLDEVTRRSLEVARSETKKPVAAMLGGMKIGYGQGISLGNIGRVVRMLGKVKPSFLDDTDGETLFSTKYTSAACALYGVDLMIEHVGPPGLEVFHQYNMLLNSLNCGAGHLHLSHLGELFDPNHWFSRTWKNLAPLVPRYRTAYRKTDAAIFHSYMTSWYRADKSNPDAVNLYDSTNTLWTPDKGYPSWGRALAAPDVVDDTMVEDGALNGRKLLVIPNSSVTVTSRKAVDAIRKWVNGGGTIIGSGQGCLAYTVEDDRSLKATPGLAGLVDAPKSASGRIERQVGKGRVILYMTPADPSVKGASGKPFVDEMMPVLEREADRAGVRRWCNADPEHKTNLIYCGRDLNSGRHLFTADFTKYARNSLKDAIFLTDGSVEFTFDPSLTGEAELVGITDSFERCEGGKAEYNAQAHTLIIRFTLPGRLKLTFGKGQSGLAVAKHSLLLWQNGDLVLRPSGGYGIAQTQEPVSVTSDGRLDPAEVQMPYIIHGNLHRGEFGRGPTFRLSLAKPGSVTVHVNSVPAHVILVMMLDGKETLRADLPSKDGKIDPFANEYNQDFTIQVPAGVHDVRIDNLGDDWVCVDRYVFEGLGLR